jgi:hypothetical protein
MKSPPQVFNMHIPIPMPVFLELCDHREKTGCKQEIFEMAGAAVREWIAAQERKSTQSSRAVGRGLRRPSPWTKRSLPHRAGPIRWPAPMWSRRPQSERMHQPGHPARQAAVALRRSQRPRWDAMVCAEQPIASGDVRLSARPRQEVDETRAIQRRGAWRLVRLAQAPETAIGSGSADHAHRRGNN